MNYDLQVLDNRLIAFLDVLGFQSWMDKESTEDVVKMYGQFIADADKTVFNPPNILPDADDLISNFASSKFVFDSIVLVSHPIEDANSICHFIMAIIQLMENGFTNNLPLRGAISLGNYVEDKANGIFVSSVFKTLHTEEQRLQWAGCCVLDEAIETVLTGLYGHSFSTDSSQRHLPLVYYPVPVKEIEGGITTISRWCLNWSYFLNSDQISKALDYLIEPKQSQTAKFVNFVEMLPGAYKQLIPGHLPPIYVRFMPTRGSCRILFTDELDNPTEPSQEITINFG